MKKKLFKNEKLNKFAPHFLLVSITALSIYPIGCFSWGSPLARPSAPSTPPETIIPEPGFVSVKAQEALTAFKCIADKGDAEQKDRQAAFNETIRIEEAIKNNLELVEFSRVMYDTLKTKYPDCNLP